MKIKHLDKNEIHRIREIDRSEHVTTHYKIVKGVLETETVDWQVPNWPDDEQNEFSIQAHIKQWAPILAKGGLFLGAFEKEKFVGFAILRPHLTPHMAQLAALYVHNDYRRKGIASALTEYAGQLARKKGAGVLYVSAIPSGSAVGFYLSKGFSSYGYLRARVRTNLGGHLP